MTGLTHFEALLPSSFAMYASTFAFAASIAPAKLGSDKRTLAATLSFATGAILGWPFALALALPFVIEELFVFGADIVPAATRPSWILARWQRLFGCGVLAALIFVSLFLFPPSYSNQHSSLLQDTCHWRGLYRVWETLCSPLEYRLLQHFPGHVGSWPKPLWHLPVELLLPQPSPELQHPSPVCAFVSPCSGSDIRIRQETSGLHEILTRAELSFHDSGTQARTVLPLVSHFDDTGA